MTSLRSARVLRHRLRNVWLQHVPSSRVAHVPGVGSICCDTGDMIQRYLYQFGVWEPTLTQVVRQNIQPGDVVVDVGANIGYYSLLAASLVGPQGRVVAFEPSPTVRSQLRRNLALNEHGARVEVVPAAAGAAHGQAQVYRATGGNLGQTATQPSPGAVLEGDVEVRSLDETIGAPDRGRVSLLKVDVEGDELSVLQGARALLASMRPGAVVLVEVDEPRLRQRGASSSGVFELMAELGFTAQLVDNSYAVASYVDPRPPCPRELDGPVARGDVVFVREGHQNG